jgi:hypothetical protein
MMYRDHGEGSGGETSARVYTCGQPMELAVTPLTGPKSGIWRET